MSVICEIDYLNAKKYIGKNVSTKINNKKHKVFFKVCCDNTNFIESIDFVSKDDNFICIDYRGLSDSDDYTHLSDNKGTYIIRVYELGNNITSDDVENVINETPKYVTPIIKLPEDFNDLRLIWEFSKHYPKVRFCGGDLFNCSGCRLGCCGLDLMRSLGIKEKNLNLDKVGCSCFCDVFQFEDLELIVTNKKVAKRNTIKTEKSNKPKEKTVKKAKVSFSSLIATNPLDI